MHTCQLAFASHPTVEKLGLDACACYAAQFKVDFKQWDGMMLSDHEQALKNLPNKGFFALNTVLSAIPYLDLSQDYDIENATVDMLTKELRVRFMWPRGWYINMYCKGQPEAEEFDAELKHALLEEVQKAGITVVGSDEPQHQVRSSFAFCVHARPVADDACWGYLCEQGKTTPPSTRKTPTAVVGTPPSTRKTPTAGTTPSTRKTPTAGTTPSTRKTPTAGTTPSTRKTPTAVVGVAYQLCLHTAVHTSV